MARRELDPAGPAAGLPELLRAFRDHHLVPMGIDHQGPGRVQPEGVGQRIDLLHGRREGAAEFLLAESVQRHHLLPEFNDLFFFRSAEEEAEIAAPQEEDRGPDARVGLGYQGCDDRPEAGSHDA